MHTLVGSVGEKGENHNLDVARVQSHLRSKGYYKGDVNGICCSATIAAIKSFQFTVLPAPDGLIEPGKSTWARLCGDSNDHSHANIEWSGDSAQWPEDKKLKSMTEELRGKVLSVMRLLCERGFRPHIFYGWRSISVQIQLYSRGKSKVRFSFHNAQKPDGTPNSYAADIIDYRYGWSPQAELAGFWKALGEEAKRHGLIWGGDWTSFRDVAHVQLLPNSCLNQVKQESGL